MPEYLVDRAMKILNHQKKAMNGAKVLVLGVAYKADIDDYRESPALEVMEHLQKQGAEASFFDPHISEYRHKGKGYTGLAELTEQALREADIVIICTAHAAVDYEFVQKHANAVFDTRNATRNVADKAKIELL